MSLHKVTEDDKDFSWILRQSLESQFLTVVYAMDGEEGLAMAQKENPDLIVIDILMPKMDGITMARKIKEKGIKSKMIFLTNFKDSDHITKALDVASEIDYIIKSDMHIDAIVERIKNKLNS